MHRLVQGQHEEPLPVGSELLLATFRRHLGRLVEVRLAQRLQNLQVLLAQLKILLSSLGNGWIGAGIGDRFRVLTKVRCHSAAGFLSPKSILASHAFIHAAEGEFFRSIVHKACEHLGIAVTPLRERELEERAKEVLGNKATQVKQRILGIGKRLGPPWTRDEKLAALAATLIL